MGTVALITTCIIPSSRRLAAQKVHVSSPRRPTASPHSFARGPWRPTTRCGRRTFATSTPSITLVSSTRKRARARAGPRETRPVDTPATRQSDGSRCDSSPTRDIPRAESAGCNANKKFAPRERIIDYHGVVTTSEDADEASDYCLAFGLQTSSAWTPRRAGNEARFANDFRNTGKVQNAKFDAYTDEKGDYKLAVFAWD